MLYSQAYQGEIAYQLEESTMASGGSIDNPSAKVYIVAAIIGAVGVVVAALIARNPGSPSSQPTAVAISENTQTPSAAQPTIIQVAIAPTLSAPTSGATTNPPYPTCLLIGDWEAEVPTDKTQLHIEWNDIDKMFQGTVIKLGDDSRSHGFTDGEVTYTAKLSSEPGVVEEQGKWRSSASSYQWRPDAADMTRWASADEGRFYDKITWARLNHSRLSSCHS